MGSAELAARLADVIASGRWSEGEGAARGEERSPGRRVARQARPRAPTPRCATGACWRVAERTRFRVGAGGAARAARWPGDLAALRLAGSDDPALDVLVRAAGESASVVPGPRGSVNGIVQLARGAADAAALHLLDAASGRWNDALARGALGGEPMVLVHLWKRDQGLVLAPGNPLGIRGVGDLDGRRIAWRLAGHGLAPAAREPDAAGGL